MAKRIVSIMPPHVHYVEPYFGGGSVLLAKNPEGVSEVVNDLDGELTNFWKVLQREELFVPFLRKIYAVPFSELEFLEAQPCPFWAHDPVASAINFFVKCRLSLAGRMKDFATLSRRRVRRGMNEQASAWISSIDGLPEVHSRLRRVVILAARPALTVISQQDGADTLFYLDPPYPHDTRATVGEYRHEMSDEDHRELLDVLKNIKGKFLLSSYPNPLYEKFRELHGWCMTLFDMPNNAAGGKEKRRMQEAVYTNFKPEVTSAK